MTTLATVIGKGVIGSRPAAASAGRLYFSTEPKTYRDNGSSWDDVSDAGTGFANPMTTAGDIIYGGASGVATRLAGGTSTYVLTSNGATSAPSWQAAAGGGGGSAILGAISYSSGANGSWQSTSSATIADIDATNASVAVTIPASGKVAVMIQAEFYVTVAHSNCALGLRSGSTNLARRFLPLLGSGGVTTTYGPPTPQVSDTYQAPTWFYLTGLTPGAMTIKAAFVVDGGGGTLNISANDGAAGHDNPFVMVVFAA